MRGRFVNLKCNCRVKGSPKMLMKSVKKEMKSIDKAMNNDVNNDIMFLKSLNDMKSIKSKVLKSIKSKEMKSKKSKKKEKKSKKESKFGSHLNAVGAPYFGTKVPFQIPPEWYLPVTNGEYQFPQSLVKIN